MTKETMPPPLDARSQRAIDELSAVIRTHYPSATFATRPGIDDPEATYLIATVDVDDPDDVLDAVVDRLLTLQVEEGLSVYVLPIHPPQRVAETMRRQHRDHAPSARPASFP